MTLVDSLGFLMDRLGSVGYVGTVYYYVCQGLNTTKLSTKKLKFYPVLVSVSHTRN